MTKKRLAEIMAEISEDEELSKKGISVLLAVCEPKKNGSHIGVVGMADLEDTEKIAISMLHTVWEQKYKAVTSFGGFMVALSAIAETDLENGAFRRNEV